MNKKLIWNFNNVSKEALKYSKRIDFKNNSTSAYQAACRNKWLNTVCNHMKGRRRWCESSVTVEAKKYTTKKEFKFKCQSAYKAANRLGIFTGSTEFRIIPPNMLNNVVSSLENCHV